MIIALIMMAEKPTSFSRPNLGRGGDRRKDHELLWLRPDGGVVVISVRITSYSGQDHDGGLVVIAVRITSYSGQDHDGGLFVIRE